jgi:hypothetical protein
LCCLLIASSHTLPPSDTSSPAEEDAAYLQTAQADLLAVLESKACVTAAPCKWAAGQGTQQLLATAKAGADSSSAALLDKAAFIGGPLLSQQQHVDLALDQTRLVAEWSGGSVNR